MVALASLMLTGCSFVTVQGAKERGIHCSTSYAAPFVDLSTVATIAVLLMTVLDDECDAGAASCAGDVVSSPVALVGALAAASTVYGGVVVRGCNNHREKLEQQVASMVANLVPVAEAGACEEVRRAAIVAEEISKDLGMRIGMRIALTNPAVLRCLVAPAVPEVPATNGT